MTKDEALRLALEFISSISPAFICEASHHKKHERHASNEPCPHVAKQKKVYEAIKSALEAKDEPDHSDELTIAYMSGLHRGKEVAQRTWVGLTSEEKIIMSRYDLEYAALIGEVERKLKEKNT